MKFFALAIGIFFVALDASAKKPVGSAAAYFNKHQLATDSDVLVVVDGQIVGTIRELKKDLNTLYPADIISSMNVLKGKEASEKYGERGKHGVIEITTREIKITDIGLAPNDAINTGPAATFPGGKNAWINYLIGHLNANVAVDKGAPEGNYTVKVKFIIEKDGSITDLLPITNFGYGMEDEVIRLLSKGPRWQPPLVNSKPVRSYVIQPVTFVVESSMISLSVNAVKAGVPTAIELLDVSYLKPEEIEVTVSSGKITPNGGMKFTITADKPGKITLIVQEKEQKKKDRIEYGRAEIIAN